MMCVLYILCGQDILRKIWRLKDLLDTYPSYICHASGHVCKADLVKFIDMVNPDVIIPVHTDSPENLEKIASHRSIYVVDDNEPFII